MALDVIAATGVAPVTRSDQQRRGWGRWVCDPIAGGGQRVAFDLFAVDHRRVLVVGAKRF